MNEYINLLLTSVLALVAAFYSSKGGLYDLRYKGWKRINKRGWTVIASTGLIVILNVFQIFYNKSQSDKDKKVAAAEKRKSDSTMQAEITKGVDSGIHQISNGLSKSFKDQELKIDTLTFTVTKLRDSAKTVINNNFPEAIPVLKIPDDGISIESKTDTMVKIKYILKSYNAPTANINIKVYAKVRYSNGFENVSAMRFGDPNSKILENGFQGTYLYMKGRTVQSFTTLWLYITGTYTTLDEKHKQRIDDVYEFRPGQEITLLRDPLKREFVNKITKSVKVD